MYSKLIVDVQRLGQTFAKHQAMRFTNIASLNPDNHPRKQALLL